MTDSNPVTTEPVSVEECERPGVCNCPGMPRCPKCNYTAHDAAYLMDHDRFCRGLIPSRPALAWGRTLIAKGSDNG